MYRPRVLIAEDHALLREAFHKLLEEQHDVVGTADNGRDLLDLALRIKPDVAVLDIAMPLLNGFDAGVQLKKRMPRVKLIFLTINEDPDIAREAIRIGGSGYLLKSSAPCELFQAIQDALRGRTYITRVLRERMEEEAFTHGAYHRKAKGDLTARQREVLQLLVEGHSMKEIGSLLGVTPRTIAFHKYHLMEEFRLKTNADLLRFAMKQHLICPQLSH